ncbi:MAG: sodium:calcium antiporter [Thaumarchaeota archaeon]|nr:sodium:calcium antiporter [Nitrososphaerota archaeon]
MLGIDLLIQSLILAFSLLLLALCAQGLVNTSARIASRLGINHFAIGFLLLSVLTSLPEMFVAIFSTSEGAVGLTLGDIFGSNVVNIAFVTGLALFIGRDRVKMPVRDLAGILYFSSLIPIILSVFEVLSKLAGAVLMIFFLTFSYLSIKKRDFADREKAQPAKLRDVAILIIGAIGTIVGAKFAVDSAISVANILTVVPLVIGAKIVAIGTSFPELMVTLQAARKGYYSMALGNSIGSNLTNMTLVLGTVLLLAPLEVDIGALRIATTFVLIATGTFWYFLSRGNLGRIQGAILLAQYTLFLLIL